MQNDLSENKTTKKIRFRSYKVWTIWESAETYGKILQTKWKRKV